MRASASLGGRIVGRGSGAAVPVNGPEPASMAGSGLCFNQ